MSKSKIKILRLFDIDAIVSAVLELKNRTEAKAFVEDLIGEVALRSSLAFGGCAKCFGRGYYDEIARGRKNLGIKMCCCGRADELKKFFNKK